MTRVQKFRRLTGETCLIRGVAAHISDVIRYVATRSDQRGMFHELQFVYDEASATTAAWQENGSNASPSTASARPSTTLHREKRVLPARCVISEPATRWAVRLRATQQHATLVRMCAQPRSVQAQHDIRVRPHLMERSFVCSSRFGLDKARCRGLWRVRIQDYLTRPPSKISRCCGELRWRKDGFWQLAATTRLQKFHRGVAG